MKRPNNEKRRRLAALSPLYRPLALRASCALILASAICLGAGCSIKQIDPSETAQSSAHTSALTESEVVTTAALTESTAVTETQSDTESATEEPTEAPTETEAPVETEPQTESIPVETEPMPVETEPAPIETEPTPIETEPAPIVTEPTPVETEPAPLDTEAPAPTASYGTSANGYPIETVNGMTYVGGVLIANKTYDLPSWYDPGGLTGETYAAFTQMQTAAWNEGISLWICSGYRSYDTQNWLYWSYVSRDGQAAADTYSARPGHSEHQTGMAIDVNNTLSTFAYSAEGIWLAEHCHEYGFIIRYPAGKEYITGYMYEPWHVRYVGTELAGILHANGLTLEEYFGIDSVYR